MNEDQQNYWQPPADDPHETAPVAGVEQDQTTAPPASTEPAGPQAAPVTWSAEEYVHIDKGYVWYILFALVILAFITADILLLKAYTFSVLVVLMSIAIVIYIRRPPRTLTYALSPQQGLYVGEKLYHFEEFKAFGLIRDGEHSSIMMIPRKRFAPGVSVYFPEEAGEKIVDILGQRLPMQELKLDVIDIVVRKLRL
ncbi:MAG TPA: hypothetical protein QF549_02450 [Candidatus Saccharimonadaceae bacterium]|nr:hypothetical protein [Candidatus Saccharimonadaceae bacterium]|tara:strand:- start:6043 stop:6633 length:591 start_codon:yes stop_codon:yes gene_type:complete